MRAARRERAHVDPRVVDRVHADAVAEQRAAACCAASDRPSRMPIATLGKIEEEAADELVDDVDLPAPPVPVMPTTGARSAPARCVEPLAQDDFSRRVVRLPIRLEPGDRGAPIATAVGRRSQALDAVRRRARSAAARIRRRSSRIIPSSPSGARPRAEDPRDAVALRAPRSPRARSCRRRRRRPARGRRRARAAGPSGT